MSNSLLNNLSEAQIAKLLEAAGISNEVAEVEPPKAVSKKTGFLVIRALGNEVSDDEQLFVEDEPQYWGDDSPITFGDLRYAVEDGATRKDGTKCRDYPNVWLLSQDQGYAAFRRLSSAKPKPKQEFRQKAAAKNSPSANDDRLARLEALVQQLAEGQFRPEPAKGHTKATPESKIPGLVQRPTPKELQTPNYSPGDVILVNGVAVQISADGKRLNKTIV